MASLEKDEKCGRRLVYMAFGQARALCGGFEHCIFLVLSIASAFSIRSWRGWIERVPCCHIVGMQ